MTWQSDEMPAQPKFWLFLSQIKKQSINMDIMY